jgi:hypothetical protein
MEQHDGRNSNISERRIHLLGYRIDFIFMAKKAVSVFMALASN